MSTSHQVPNRISTPTNPTHFGHPTKSQCVKPPNLAKCRCCMGLNITEQTPGLKRDSPSFDNNLYAKDSTGNIIKIDRENLTYYRKVDSKELNVQPKLKSPLSIRSPEILKTIWGAINGRRSSSDTYLMSELTLVNDENLAKIGENLPLKRKTRQDVIPEESIIYDRKKDSHDDGPVLSFGVFQSAVKTKKVKPEQNDNQSSHGPVGRWLTLCIHVCCYSV